MADAKIARVAWDLPNGEEHVHWMTENEGLVFGRAPECQIQFGRVPYDEAVPTMWGQLTWNGRMRVENIAERTAKWSFSLVPSGGPGAAEEEGPCVVAPGREISLAQSQFESAARAPGGLGFDYSIRVNAFRRPGNLPTTSEPPSVVMVSLTETEKIMGRALIDPLDQGSAVPATYDAISKMTHYARDGVRDALERIDAKFVAAGLYRAGPTGRTPDRVARVLLEHRSLLSP